MTDDDQDGEAAGIAATARMKTLHMHVRPGKLAEQRDEQEDQPTETLHLRVRPTLAPAPPPDADED